MEKYPVLSQVQPGYLAKLLPKSAPNIPEPIETILHDIQQYIIPGMTHWQSPNYFAYFPSSGTIVGFLGEMLGLPQSFLFFGTGDDVIQGTTFKVAGLECKNFRVIKSMKSTAFQLPPDSLQTAIRLDIEAELIPFFLCVTIGTTSTTTVDLIRSLSEVTKDYGILIHVDAAYAGSACIGLEYWHFIDGIVNVNSFSLNAYKWFFTTLD
ncbi:hypothetical protein Gotur_020270 [Gossypium turneri]